MNILYGDGKPVAICHDNDYIDLFANSIKYASYSPGKNEEKKRKRTTNCCNCGAPLSHDKTTCEYCGTSRMLMSDEPQLVTMNQGHVVMDENALSGSFMEAPLRSRLIMTANSIELSTF